MKIALFANTDWYLYNFRRSLALAAAASGYEVLLISPPGPYGPKLNALGLRWLPAPMERNNLNPLRDLHLLSWLWRTARTEKIALFHNFTIKNVIYGSIIAHLLGIRRVNAIAGMGYIFTNNSIRANFLRPIIRILLRLTLSGNNARLILQNEDDVKLFSDSGVVSSKTIRLIPGSGVNCSEFAPIPAEASGWPKVVMAARMLWDKGVAEFVDAAGLLKGRGVHLEFVLAGEPDPGNPSSISEAILNSWNESGVVRWLGHVVDMPQLFQCANIVVLPSYREGLPKSLIEAAACARPIVTTDVPGCRAVVTDGVNGLLIPPRDGPALANAIWRLLNDPSLARRLGNAARAKVLAEYADDVIIGQTLKVYAELCGPP